MCAWPDPSGERFHMSPLMLHDRGLVPPPSFARLIGPRSGTGPRAWGPHSYLCTPHLNPDKHAWARHIKKENQEDEVDHAVLIVRPTGNFQDYKGNFNKLPLYRALYRALYPSTGPAIQGSWVRVPPDSLRFHNFLHLHELNSYDWACLRECFEIYSAPGTGLSGWNPLCECA